MVKSITGIVYYIFFAPIDDIIDDAVFLLDTLITLASIVLLQFIIATQAIPSFENRIACMATIKQPYDNCRYHISSPA